MNAADTSDSNMAGPDLDWHLYRRVENEPGRPWVAERWYGQSPVYGCENRHVSTMVLRSEALGRMACLACQAPVFAIELIPEEARVGQL